MPNITKTNFNDIVAGVTLTKVCSVKPDGDSEESKQVTVNMIYNGLRLGDIFTKALSSDIIKFQASARKRFDKLEKVIDVHAKSPGATPQVDPEDAIRAKIAGMKTKEEKLAYVNSLIEKAT